VAERLDQDCAWLVALAVIGPLKLAVVGDAVFWLVLSCCSAMRVRRAIQCVR
jgi:hypothetical protein